MSHKNEKDMTHKNEKVMPHENVEKDMPQKMGIAMVIPGGQSNLLIRLFSLSFTRFCAFAWFSILRANTNLSNLSKYKGLASHSKLL